MKNAKRIASLMLALMMFFALAISVSAARTEVATEGSLKILDNGNVLASQKTFAAYKALDLKVYAGDPVTFEYFVPADLVEFYEDRYSISSEASDFIVKVQAGIRAEEDLFAFAADVAAVATEVYENGTAVEGGFEFSSLPLGYYAIIDTTATGDYIKPVSAVMLDTVTPNVEIEVKADKPVIDKKIDEDNDLDTTDDLVEVSNAAIGDTVTYVITSNVPEMINYDKYFFIVKDQMSAGLTYNNNLEITVGDKTLSADDYILTVNNNEDGTTDLKIVFKNFIQYNTAEFLGKSVVITYTATLNDKAVLYTDANTNEVYLQYSANPSVDYVGENEPDDSENGEDKDKEPLGETPKEEVATFTTALEIVKTDPLGDRLQGAEFTLSGTALNSVRVTKSEFVLDENGTYWKLTDGSYTTTDPESMIDELPVDKDAYASLTDKYTKNTTVELKTIGDEVVNISGAVGQDGILRFEGLKAGVYTITELKAPDGYNILDDELNITINWDGTSFTITGANMEDGSDAARITIVNQEGNELPETGGIGTTVFYIVGSVLVMAAIILLVTKKRMAVK